MMRLLPVMLAALLCGGFVLAQSGEKHDSEGEEKEKKFKDPEDCEVLHDAMEVIGFNAKKIQEAMKKRKTEGIAEHLKSMQEYAAVAGDLEKPDTIQTPEQEKEFAELLEDLEEKLEAAGKAAEGGDASKIGKAMRDVGRTCGTCHDKYQPKEENGHGEGHGD